MIVLDTETTGLNPDKHSIVSVGAVEFDPVKLGFRSSDKGSRHGARQPENQFYEECRIGEDTEITQEALDINGFSREEITDTKKQTAGRLLENFLSWVRNCEEWTVAGHNVHCDIQFIDRVAERFEVEPLDHGRGGVFHDRIIDTHSLVWMDMAQAGRKLPKDGMYSDISSSFIFEYVGINHTRDTHNALEDAKLTAEAIARLLYDEKLFAEFF